MKLIRFSLNKLWCACAMACCALPVVYAQDQEVEFDERFLGMVAGQPSTDLSKYRRSNPIPSGDYRVEVHVNGIRQGVVVMRVEEREDAPVQGICLTPQLASVLSLKSAAYRYSPSEQCVNIVQAIPEADIQFDMGKLALHLEIPQVLVQRRPRGYVPPALWQQGSPVAFVRYYVSQQIHRSTKQERRTTRHANLRAGLNVGGWSARHQGSISWVNQTSSPYQYQQTYVERDIDTLNGRLTLGDFATRGQFFGSMTIRGVQLVSEERMLPSILRGYAPVIEGVVRSQARVVVYQQDRVIYETNVPAGAFRIDDLYPSGYSGDLLVEITESDGQVRTFSVPFARGVRLLRQGQWRYKMAVGRLRQGTKTLPETEFQGEWQYGLRNGLTLNAGANGSDNYAAGLLGLAFALPVGAFYLDLHHTRYRFPHLLQKQKKYALNVGYNVHLSSFKTGISAHYYRSFSPEHYSLSQVLDINRFGKILPFLTPLQQRISVSLNQPLRDGWGSVSVSGLWEKYWRNPTARYRYQLTYGNHFKQLNYQLGYSVSRQSNALAKKDHQLSLNFSWLFGGQVSRPMLYGTYQHTNEGYRVHTSLSGALGQEGKWTYSLSASQIANQRYYSVNSGYKTSMARLNLGYSHSQYHQQGQVSITGAVVAHAKGVTLSHDIGDTFAIIHAKGAGGAKINNSNGVYLDRFGNGIVPYVSPYRTNYVGIDPTPVLDRVEVDATGQEIIPRANSAVLVEFKTKSGTVALFDVNLENGEVPPLAAEIFDQHNQHIGYVVQGGRVFVRGIAERGTLKVVWGSRENEQCQFNYQLSADPLQAVAVQCQ